MTSSGVGLPFTFTFAFAFAVAVALAVGMSWLRRRHGEPRRPAVRLRKRRQQQFPRFPTRFGRVRFGDELADFFPQIFQSRVPVDTEADEQSAWVEKARDDVAFRENVRDGASPEAEINKARRRLFEAAEKQLADQHAWSGWRRGQIASAQARF